MSHPHKASKALSFDGAVYEITVEKIDGRTKIEFTTTNPPIGLGHALYSFEGRIPSPDDCLGNSSSAAGYLTAWLDLQHIKESHPDKYEAAIKSLRSKGESS